MKLIYSHEAREKIRHLHPEVKSGIKRLLEDLSENSHMGKPLQRELTGFWSVRFKKYRVIYKPGHDGKSIQIYTLGERKNIYDDFSPSHQF